MPAGRPRIKIDKRQFESLCEIQCTLEEICGVFGCSEDTIERWCKSTYEEKFADVFKKKRCGGRASLRRRQWNLAENNATMAIWLGKQYLGQRDSFPEEVDNKQIVKQDELLEAIKKAVTDAD